MNRETMEYSIGQHVVYEYGGKFTGKIAGQSGEDFIVLLDNPPRTRKAVLVPSGIIRPLICHWCMDTKKIYVPSFTGLESVIPQVDCPYC